MRLGFAVALLAFGVAGVTAAGATDGPVAARAGFSAAYFERAQRSAMLCVWDDEPGVVVRSYWRAPWRHHHYFPASGLRPKLGRRENLSTRVRPAKAAQTFYRAWSNEWAFAHERPALSVDAPAPAQARRPPQIAK